MRFVRLGLLLAATLGFANIAAAADMPVKAASFAPVLPSWSGWYLGAHIGYGWEDPTYVFTDPGQVAFIQCPACFSGFTNSTRDSSSGLLGGIHGGYNWQLNPTWVVGIEGDFTWSGMKSSVSTGLLSTNAGGGAIGIAGTALNVQTDINWLASVRGRLGYTTGPWLLYASAGVAWLDYDFRGTASCSGGACTTVTSSTAFGNTTVGWTVGAGVEWQLPASNWRTKVEYLYYRFDFTDTGTGTFFLAGGAPAGCRFTASCAGVFSVGDIDMHTVRVGVSYAFH